MKMILIIVFIKKLWTLSKIKSFINEFYPKYSNIWSKIKHPTQVVDFVRLLVLYHFGGVYWQYESVLKTNLKKFKPPRGKTIQLFVESIITKEYSDKMKNEPI